VVGEGARGRVQGRPTSARRVRRVVVFADLRQAAGGRLDRRTPRLRLMGHAPGTAFAPLNADGEWRRDSPGNHSPSMCER
jgi:hypothetical protein